VYFSAGQKEANIWTNYADIFYLYSQQKKIRTIYLLLIPGVEASEVSPWLSSETNESSRVRVIIERVPNGE